MVIPLESVSIHKRQATEAKTSRSESIIVLEVIQNEQLAFDSALPTRNQYDMSQVLVSLAARRNRKL